MKRLTKVLILLFGILFILIGILVSALFLLPETDWIRSRVQQQLQQQTNQEVVLGSLKVRPTFPGLVRITVEGISVQSQDGNELFSADRIILQPALIALVKGELSISSIRVEHFQVRVARETGGTINSFLPKPSATKSPRVEEKIPPSTTPPEVRKTETKTAKQIHPARQQPSLKGELPGNLTWSIKSVKLINGSIIYVDSEIIPGRKSTIPITNVNGVLSQGDRKEPIQMDLSAQLGDSESSKSNIKVTGTLLPTPEYSDLSKVHVKIVCESILLKYFRTYIPSGKETRVAKEFNLANFTADMTWKKPEMPIVAFRVELLERPKGGAKLNVDGSIIVTSDFAAIKQARWKAESDGIPLNFLAVSLPHDVPLRKHKGILRVGLRGEWTHPNTWQLSGSVKLDDAFLKKPFNAFGNPVRILAQVNMTPEELNVESLEVSRKITLASITGKVLKPLSKNPKIDLNCKAQCNSKCMRRLGMQIPPELKIQGSIPVIAHVKGARADIWLDLRADLTPVGISWTPFLEKQAGRKGNVGIKGKLFAGGSKKSKPSRFNGLGSVNMLGVKLRPTPHSPWLLNSQVLLDTKINSKNNVADLTDLRGSVRVGTEARDLLTISGHATKLGSADPSINLRARLHFDSRILHLSGAEIPSNLILQGSAPLRAIIKGSTKLMNWWLKLPLVHLDISYKDHFKKPVGTQGEIKAHGNWTENQVTLKRATLSLPGAKLIGEGKFKTRKPDGQQLDIKLDKTNLKTALKYVPQAQKLALSGLVTGSLTISSTDENTNPVGAIQFLGVNLSPNNSPLRLAHMKGTLRIDGDSIKIPKLTGSVGGFVKGPFTIHGQLGKIQSYETMHGRLNLTMKDVELEQRSIVNLVKHARDLVGTLLALGSSGRPEDMVRFETVSGDFHIDKGSARTENLSLRGPATNMGLIGDYHLSTSKINMLVGIRTMVISGQALTRIPAVKKFVKKHEELLKITGLDKELGRLGIKIPKEGESDGNKPIKTRIPAFVFLKIRGPATNPQISPVLANSLNKKTESRLKSLIE